MAQALNCLNRALNRVNRQKHLLNAMAANALLNTLDEPAGDLRSFSPKPASAGFFLRAVWRLGDHRLGRHLALRQPGRCQPASQDDRHARHGMA